MHKWIAASLLALAVATAASAAPLKQIPPPDTTINPAKYLETPPGKKPRVVITADPELDDNNSMIRYVLMSDGYTTEGLVYSSSQFHWTGDGKGTLGYVPNREYSRNGNMWCPCESYRWDKDHKFIDDIVDAYEKAYPNLRVHSKGFITPAEMRAKVKWGNVEFDGDISKDTDGSNLIKALLLDDINEPIYLHAWGGQSSIGRALKSIEDQYKNTPQWPAIRAKVISKAVIHPSGDQDDIGGRYIKPYWPDIRYGNGGGAFGAGLAYNAQATAADVDKPFYSAEWMTANVYTKGAMGAQQRYWGDGKEFSKGDITDYFGLSGFTADELRAKGYMVWTPPRPKGEFLAEGDTGTFLSLLDNGLEGWRQENRRTPTAYALAGTTNIVSFGAAPMFAPGAAPAPPPAAPAQRPPSRFLPVLMNDLAGRLDWATKANYQDANHYPSVSAKAAKISARPGARVSLRASARDPDGDAVTLEWFRFENNGSYAGTAPIALRPTANGTSSFTVPADAKPGDTIHFAVQATDNGKIPLTRFARTVVTVR